MTLRELRAAVGTLAGIDIAGGYIGLPMAALAFHLSAADIINVVYQRAVLLVGAARGRPPQRVPEAAPHAV